MYLTVINHVKVKAVGWSTELILTLDNFKNSKSIPMKIKSTVEVFNNSNIEK